MGALLPSVPETYRGLGATFAYDAAAFEDMGDFNTTTTSCTDDPSLLNTETVALGGSLAKDSPLFHSSISRAVRAWPAALTGRSANMMAFDETPSSLRMVPSRTAPPAFRTIIEGTTRGLALVGTPIVFSAGGAGEFCASANPDPTRVAAATSNHAASFAFMTLFPKRLGEPRAPLLRRPRQ